MRKKVFAVFVLAAVVAVQTFAFQFSPLEQFFSPGGSDSTKTYTVVNDSDDDIAIVMSALVRDQSESGEEINKDASRYFSITPSKMIVRPRSTQVVRVQYKGPKTVTTELSFRLRAEQVKYSLGRQQGNQTMFNFLYIYTTSLYVAPSKVVEKLEIAPAVPVRNDETGDLGLRLTVVNSGNVHKILNGIEVTVTDRAGKKVVLSGSDALPGLDGINILAKKRITKIVPWPEGLEIPEDLSVQYKASVSTGK